MLKDRNEGKLARMVLRGYTHGCRFLIYTNGSTFGSGSRAAVVIPANGISLSFQVICKPSSSTVGRYSHLKQHIEDVSSRFLNKLTFHAL